MPLVACQCGKSYNLKDEFAGKEVKCPACGQTLAVPFTAEAVMKVLPQAERAFDRDVFLLRQKHFSINEKYVVWDDQGQPILFIERPSHFLQSVVAMMGAIAALLVVGIALGFLTSVMPNELLQVIFGIITGIAAITAAMVAGIWLSPKRHVTFYHDQSRQTPILKVFQDQKAVLFVATYTVTDVKGSLLAKLSKNYLYNFFRKQWWCHGPDGALLCTAKEDSLILALLRRFLGPMLGLLRTNFIIVAPNSDYVIGEFNRKFTILDRYALDLRGDPQRLLDRRVALAIGVMLDTGERR